MDTFRARGKITDSHVTAIIESSECNVTVAWLGFVENENGKACVPRKKRSVRKVRPQSNAAILLAFFVWTSTAQIRAFVRWSC